MTSTQVTPAVDPSFSPTEGLVLTGAPDTATGLAGVTAAAGPFPETTVTATMDVPAPPGQSGTQQLTVVGCASPGGPVDDFTLISGHWATQLGQAVVLTDGWIPG